MGVTEEGKAFRILHSSGPCCKFGIKACFSDFKALDPAPKRSFLPLLSLLREPALRSGRNAVATAGEETTPARWSRHLRTEFSWKRRVSLERCDHFILSLIT